MAEQLPDGWVRNDKGQIVRERSGTVNQFGMDIESPQPFTPPFDESFDSEGNVVEVPAQPSNATRLYLKQIGIENLKVEKEIHKLQAKHAHQTEGKAYNPQTISDEERTIIRVNAERARRAREAILAAQVVNERQFSDDYRERELIRVVHNLSPERKREFMDKAGLQDLVRETARAEALKTLAEVNGKARRNAAKELRNG